MFTKSREPEGFKTSNLSSSTRRGLLEGARGPACLVWIAGRRDIDIQLRRLFVGF